MINTSLVNSEIDWEAIRQRLSRASTGIAAAENLSPEAAKTVMDIRARDLARVPSAPPNAADVLEVITFELAGERFGVETSYVRGVVRPADLASVPGSPAFLIGVTNLRGEVLAVMDLHQVLGVSGQARTELPWVVVLGTDRAEFGVAADVMDEVLLLRIDELLQPSASGAGVRREYLRGVTREALTILDGATLLNDSRLFIEESEEY